MYFTKEEVNNDGEDPEKDIVNEVIHGRHCLPLDFICRIWRHLVAVLCFVVRVR
jgi:hypothetical protein